MGAKSGGLIALMLNSTPTDFLKVFFPNRKGLKYCALVILMLGAILAAYTPVGHAGFIWDDDYHLTSNPCIIGPWGLKEIWTSARAVYYPLVLTAFYFEHRLWGLNPHPYHVVVVLIHFFDALLLWKVLRALQARGAWLGAMLWALHPIQVESVAWVTEQKNTQSCLFYLLSVLFFVRWSQRFAGDDLAKRSGGTWLPYLISLFSGILALLSKTSTVMLPVILSLCVWWMGGFRKGNYERPRPILFVGLAPFFCLSAFASLWTIWEQMYHSGATGASWSLAPIARLILAGRIPWFYLEKLAWPNPLLFIYPRWVIDPSKPLAWAPLIATFSLFFLLYHGRNRTQWQRSAFFAYACFVASLFPVMGFFNVYFFRYSYVGDHFQYLAGMAPLALVGAGVARATDLLVEKNSSRGGLIFCAMIALLLLTPMGFLTHAQCIKYGGSETLWRETLRENPDSTLALNNLGNLLADRAEPVQAAELFERALIIDPEFAEVHCNLASVLLDEGDLDRASLHLLEAIRLNPKSPEGHFNMGKLFLRRGAIEDALKEYRRAAELNPDFTRGHLTLGMILTQQGRWAEALTEYQKVVLIEPSNAEALAGLGSCFLSTGQVEKASSLLRQALVINPDLPDARNNLGIALAQLGKAQQAVTEFREAVKLQPKNVDFRRNLERALGQAYLQVRKPTR